MIPKLAASGKSFKGAYQYYAHDKKARSSERVAFHETRNLGTQDLDSAWRIMAMTANQQEQLKHQEKLRNREQNEDSKAGDLRGRKLEHAVLSYSLSWSPDEKPDKAHMLNSADASIAALNAQEHQAFIVAHNDESHPHLHIIINRVHPETGKALPESYSKRKLSKWASDYERQHGIQCQQREENRRKQEELAQQRQPEPTKTKGKLVRNRDQIIQEAWNQSDNGQSFAAALKEQGYLLAIGDPRGKDKRRIVVVMDPEGRPINPVRHIEGDNGKNIRSAQFNQRLVDLDLKVLPGVNAAKTIQQDRQHFDRDQYQAEQDLKIEQAAIDAARRQPTKPSTPHPEKTAKENTDIQKAGKEKSYQSVAEELDRQRSIDAVNQQKIDDLQQTLDRQYDRPGMQQRLKEAQERLKRSDTLLGRLSGRQRRLQDEVEALQKNLANIRQRENEQIEALRRRIEIEQNRERQHQKPRQEPTSPRPRYGDGKELADELRQRNHSANDNAERESDRAFPRKRGRSRDDGGGFER